MVAQDGRNFEVKRRVAAEFCVKEKNVLCGINVFYLASTDFLYALLV